MYFETLICLTQSLIYHLYKGCLGKYTKNIVISWNGQAEQSMITLLYKTKMTVPGWA